MILHVMTELLFIVIGLAIGVVVGLLVEKSKSSAMAAKYELKQQELTNSEARMQQEMENRLAMQKAHYEEVMTTKEQASRQAQEEQEKRHQEAPGGFRDRCGSQQSQISGEAGVRKPQADHFRSIQEAQRHCRHQREL